MLSDVIEELKAKVHITDAILKFGKGEFADANYTHPFRGAHGTHDSSSKNHCYVDPERGYWHCFSCGEGGSVVDWVLSSLFSYNRACLSEAVKLLAAEAGIEAGDALIDTEAYNSYRILTEIAREANEALKKNKKAMGFLEKKYGIELQTIDDLCLGYLPALPERYEREDLIKAGLWVKSDAPLVGRIIFPFWKGAVVQYMAGRYLGDAPPDIPKYTALAAQGHIKKIPYNYDRAINSKRNNPIVIVEGLADAAIGHQHGFQVLALSGLKPVKSNPEDLLRVCEIAGSIYIIFDSETTGRGLVGAKMTAQYLVDHGYNPAIVQLPLEDKNHVDLAEYFLEHSEEDFKTLLDTRKCLADLTIEECSKRPNPYEFEKIILTFAGLSDNEAQPFLKELSKKTEAPIAQLRKDMNALRKKRENTPVLELMDKYRALPFFAQCYKYDAESDVWMAHMTVFAVHLRSTTSKGKSKTKEELLPVHLEVEHHKGGRYSVKGWHTIENPPAQVKALLPAEQVLTPPGSDFTAWSFTNEYPYSFKNFVEGRCPHVDIAALYEEIYSLFRKYVSYPDSADAHILTLYVFWSYIYMGFEATPYIHCRGVSGSGKTTTLKLLKRMCFNALYTSMSKAAAAVRAVHSSRTTLFLDEGEKLGMAAPGSDAFDLVEMCLGGSDKDGTKILCAEDNTPIQLSIYCPKVIGSIKAVGPVLGNRTILITCRPRAANDLKDIRVFNNDAPYLEKQFQNIRDKLHVWAMTQFRWVRDEYDRIQDTEYDFLHNRVRDVWLPLLTIARIVELHYPHKIIDKLVPLIEAKTKARMVEDAEGDFAFRVILALRNILRDSEAMIPLREAKEKTYMPSEVAVKRIIERLREEQQWVEGESVLQIRTFHQFLRDIGATDKNIRQISFTVPGYKETKITHIHLDRTQLEYYIRSKEVGEETVDELRD